MSNLVGAHRVTPNTSIPARATNLSRHGRSGEPWTRTQALKNDLIALAVRAGFRVADGLPESWLLRIGRFLGRVSRLVLPRAHAEAQARALSLMPETRARRVARLCFERAGEHLALCLLLRRADIHASRWVRIPETSRDTLDQVLSRGRGLVFVSAHLGPFELLAATIAELGYQPSVVVRESYDPRLDEWVDAHRYLHGVGVIHRGDPGAGARILRALRAGRPVGFLPDLGGRVPSVTVSFVGRRVEFPIGPQRIAQRVGAPLVVGWLARNSADPNGPQFEIQIVEVDTRGALGEVCERVALMLERAILGPTPEDWLWMAPQNPRLQADPGWR